MTENHATAPAPGAESEGGRHRDLRVLEPETRTPNTTSGAYRYADLLAGYVTRHRPDAGIVELRTPDGATVSVTYTDATSAELLRNLGEAAVPVREVLPDLLTPGRHVFVHGVFFPDTAGVRSVQATHLVLSGDRERAYRFERPDWWPHQLVELARFYRRSQFGDDDPDFGAYRTNLGPGGEKRDEIQEADTISRLVYGMASAYLLTGDEDFLLVAERGTEYLREHMRFVDHDDDVVYWYHGIDLAGGRETKLFASEFDDDRDAIPAYEQIYALTGPTQTYRVTGDPRILADIEGTLRMFDRFYRDPEQEGYFSHLDPVRLSPHAEELTHNRSRKNWNSIGDHAPAYLFNLYLATGERRHADRLEECFDLIVRHFPDPDSPFVHERFHQDWTPDRTWGWQQDRAVVGHNLKIAWNLMRMNALRPKEAYRRLAASIGTRMPAAAGDRRRGGWYDVVERTRTDVSGNPRLVWHDRKAWWQQEQAILAYLILAGNTGDDLFRRYARESAAFYNAFFLDHDAGGVYFNVLADGMPYLRGIERQKGSHAMSVYHASELCLLATVYQRLLVDDEPLELWFRPRPDGFSDRILRVAPDVLPPGRVRLERVAVDGRSYQGFDPTGMAVALPDSAESLTVRVRLVPTGREAAR